MEKLLHKSEIELGNFAVSILNKPFTGPDGIVHSNTAQVDFFDSRGKKINVVEYGYKTREEIFKLIESQNLNLNNCYVNNFSLSEYRKVSHLSSNEPVSFVAFSAKNSFFDCDHTTDFSFASFQAPKISFESAVFGNGLVNFTGAKFSNSTVSFRRTRFGDGTIDFRFAEFGEGNISFHYSHFGLGDVSFVNTNFGDSNVDFQSTTFGDGNIDFKYAKFGKGDITFEKAIFGNGKKDFKAVEFGEGKVDFKRVQFGSGDISFEGAEFGAGKISFRLSTFGKGNISFEMADFTKTDVSFEKVEFASGRVTFRDAKVDQITFKASQLDAYFDFKFSQCNYLDLTETIIRDVIDFLSDDLKTNIKILNFSGMKNFGRIIIDWKDNDVKSIIYNQKETTFRQKANQFRVLKEEFHSAGKYNDEDRAYVEFKRCEQKAHLEVELKTNPFNFLWAYPSYFFKWLIFDKMGKYATNPMRVILSVLIVYSVYSVLYFVIPLFSAASLESSYQLTDAHSLGVAFYYSAVTFFTIGFGDYYPMGYLRILAATEGFTGVFLMSYFTVAFVRKILR